VYGFCEEEWQGLKQMELLNVMKLGKVGCLLNVAVELCEALVFVMQAEEVGNGTKVEIGTRDDEAVVELCCVGLVNWEMYGRSLLRKELGDASWRMADLLGKTAVMSWCCGL